MITISALTIYPVKSMKGVSLPSCDVNLIGLSGDRRWLVVDAFGKFKTIREMVEMAQVEAAYEGGVLRLSHPLAGSVLVPLPERDAPQSLVTIWRSDVLASHASATADAFLAKVFGQAWRLVYLGDVTARNVNPKFSNPNDHVSFADGYPILLTSESSRRDLEMRVGSDFDARRFRANIVVEGADAWREDTWKRIQIGSTIFRVAKPSGRCIVTTLDPDTGEKSEANEPLTTLAKFHRAASGDIIFGQNLIPDGTGRIAVGDEVKVLEVGVSNLV